MNTADFKELFVDLLEGYEFNIEGLYLKDGSMRPLPSESSVIGKVIEGSILEHLRRVLSAHRDLNVIEAKGSRTYPDLTVSGSRIHPDVFAVDIKCARRKSLERLESAIAIGTYDAEYFHYPNEKVSNIELPYDRYTAHLSLIAMYEYAGATARDVEVILVEKWRVARRTEASGTRSYIATSTLIEDLRNERGEFATEAEFNDFWRSKPVKKSKQDRWRKKRGIG